MNVKNVYYDNYFTAGCETCDYGSNYVSNIDIYLEDGESILIRTEQMYEYTLTESDFMQLLANAKNTDDFYKKMFKIIKDRSFDIKSRVGLQDMFMSINGNEINIVKSCNEERMVKENE